ncbi:MAG TPA: hypothetical protein VIY48_11770 [Candidatus Paceibacterota bacterium]
MSNMNEHTGREVTVSISDDWWFRGVIEHSDNGMVKVAGPTEYPALSGYYPSTDVTLLPQKEKCTCRCMQGKHCGGCGHEGCGYR